MPASRAKKRSKAVEASEEEASDGKASDQLRVRISEALKDQLKEALKEHKHYRGNISEFVNEAIMAFVLQTRRGEEVLHPLEFVSVKR